MGWKPIEVSDFLTKSKFMETIHGSCVGKMNDLKCRFCGSVIYTNGQELEFCCQQREETLKKIQTDYAKSREKDDDTLNAFIQNMGASGFEGFEKSVTFKSFKIHDPKLTAVVDMCKDFIKNHEMKNLILSGSVGSGKTHLACATARYIGRYTGATFGIVRCSTVGIDDKYGFEVLVIDDIGRELGSDAKIKARRGIISEIIEERYRNEMRTIITTNLKDFEIVEKFGSHIYDRITSKSVIVPRQYLEFEESYRSRS